jgi:hypothetical protein
LMLALLCFGVGVAVAPPLHTFVYQSLLPQELRARGQLQFPD